MIKNYFKTAWRNLMKNKFYSFITITGLAVGLATCLLIFLYVSDELNFDQFNKNAKNIYRIDSKLKFGGNEFDLAVSPPAIGPSAVRELPQVKQYTRIRDYGNFLVKKGNENLRENRVAYADSTLFSVFTLPMLAGDAASALKEPYSLVITESVAKKYFPQDAVHNPVNVIGRNLTVNDTGIYKITGVIKDIPAASHFHFDFFMSMSEDNDSRSDDWLSTQTYNTYILLDKRANSKVLESALNEMTERYAGPQLKSMLDMSMDDLKKNGGFIRAGLTPLTDIHLHSNKTGELSANGNFQFVYIFSAIALFILLIACVNFMNLSTARSSNRAKEVGIRKVLGSLQKNLIAQFLTESFLISFIALVLSVLIAGLLLPYFNQLAGKTIMSNRLFQPSTLLSLVVLIIIAGFLAGSYPAFFLSSFQPVNVLKGRLAGGFKRSWLRNSLVVFQFVISIVLIIGTVVIYNQLDYIRTKNIGFNRKQVLVIQHTDALKNNAAAFKNELAQISGIENVTLSGYLPTNFYRSNNTFFTSPAIDLKTAMSCQDWKIDENYIPTLGINLSAGRNFSAQFPADSTGVIINEAAARFIGTKNLLNKKLYNVENAETKETTEYHIIGVIKDFNFSSLRNTVTPLVMKLRSDNAGMAVRISTAAIPPVIAQIKIKWQAMGTGQPLDYSFMDEQFDHLYTTEQRTGQLFIAFALLAIVIGCLGLFGLVTYAAEQRTKEIGIRKVLGASVRNIITMISKDFLKLIVIASVIAFPVAWWASNEWLQSFAYRINISWWFFVIASGIAIIIAFITISFQAIKAAVANPVKSLRTE